MSTTCPDLLCSCSQTGKWESNSCLLDHKSNALLLLHAVSFIIIELIFTQLFNGPLSGMSGAGWYQNHSPTYTRPVHQTSFINFLHLL